VWGEIKHPTLYKITGVCLKPLMPQIWTFAPKTVDTPTVGTNFGFSFEQPLVTSHPT
jgi:hypothetical protein